MSTEIHVTGRMSLATMSPSPDNYLKLAILKVITEGSGIIILPDNSSVTLINEKVTRAIRIEDKSYRGRNLRGKRLGTSSVEVYTYHPRDRYGENAWSEAQAGISGEICVSEIPEAKFEEVSLVKKIS